MGMSEDEEQLRRPPGHRQRAEEKLPLDVLRGRGGRLCLRAADAGERGERNESEAALLEAWDEALHSGERLRAVPAAVVEEDNATAMAGRGRVSNDLRNARPLPVLGVVVGQRDQVSGVDGRGDRRLLGGGDGLRAAGIGRPEERRANVGRPGDRRVRHRHLEMTLPLRDRRQVHVVEGVVAKLEAVVGEVAHHPGVADDVLPDLEEGGLDPEPLERGRDPGCPCRIRAVVEGQRHAPAHAGLARDEAFPGRPPDRGGTVQRGMSSLTRSSRALAWCSPSRAPAQRAAVRD